MDPSQLEKVGVLIRSLERSQVVKYLDVTSAALFIWDHIVTFREEVELVWQSRWGAGNILFLLVRYTTWPDVLVAVSQKIFPVDPTICKSTFEYLVWSMNLGITAAEMILVLRTWAIWNGHRGLLVILTTVLLGGAGACYYVATIYLSRTQFIAADTLSPHVHGCLITGSTSLVAVSWIALTVFDFAIMTLTMIKAVQHFRFGKGSSPGFVASLYRDGLLYFIYLFVMSLANIVVLYLAPAEYTILFSELHRVLHAVLPCRIILHLRGALQASSGDASTGPAASVPVFRSQRPRDDGGVSAWFGNVSSETWDTETTDVELCTPGRAHDEHPDKTV